MSAERRDTFEEQLVVRLGVRAESVGGSAPLAALREAGRRRARRQLAVRGVASVVLLAAGVGALGQLGGGSGGAPPAAGTSTGAPTGAPSATMPWRAAGPVNGCQAGPSSLRTPGWYVPPGAGRTAGNEPLGAQQNMPGMAPESVMATRTDSWFPFDPALDQAARAVADLGVGKYRDQFFGMCVDTATKTLYVMRKQGAYAFDSAVRERVFSGNVRYEFRDAAESRVVLDALGARITEEARSYWPSKGVTLIAVAVCGDGAGVRVDVGPQADLEAVRAAVLARYGPLVVEVVQRHG
ncbi:hypothetical protein [Streptomyces sp. NRRL WC-3742]|uniref:hypothetical protein n=1 Tax=Streptomyces sp. NRRL WC-3742 TaxID=1463934 RepID=UPI0004C86A3A|nr:hypothetical protein [Streptomyces sp. NRRL WC-3742]